MENFILVVLDDEPSYAQHLQAGLRELKAEIDVLWADNPEALNDIYANHSPQAYLISAPWRDRGYRVNTGNARVIALEEARLEGAAAAPDTVYRSDAPRQTAALLARMLLHRTRVIGIFGVSGGAGNTTAFMALALGFAARDNSVKQRNRVLALSLEPCAAFSPFSSTDKIGLPEILYAMDSGGDVEQVIDAARCRYAHAPNIESFHHTEYDVDRTELRPGDAANLLAILKRMNRWDVILVDLESRMSDLLFEVWQASERMVMMIPHTAIGEEKLRLAERDLKMRQMRGEAELEKLVPVLNFASEDLPSFPVLERRKPFTISRGDPELVRRMRSEDWCEFLVTERGTEMFKEVLDEVSK